MSLSSRDQDVFSTMARRSHSFLDLHKKNTPWETGWAWPGPHPQPGQMTRSRVAPLRLSHFFLPRENLYLDEHSFLYLPLRQPERSTRTDIIDVAGQSALTSSSPLPQSGVPAHD